MITRPEHVLMAIINLLGAKGHRVCQLLVWPHHQGPGQYNVKVHFRDPADEAEVARGDRRLLVQHEIFVSVSGKWLSLSVAKWIYVPGSTTSRWQVGPVEIVSCKTSQNWLEQLDESILPARTLAALNS